MKNLIWSEKYRPKDLGEFIGSNELKAKIRELVKNPKALPNMMFISKNPGTGKTSLAHVIRNEIGCPDRDFLIMNSSDERKLEHIRGRVKDFSMTMSSKPDVPRVVLMDEFDGMRWESQDALRFLMERYSSNCKFLFTLNDENKIIEPIKSRCVVIYLKELPREDIADRLVDIALKEKIYIEEGAEFNLVDTFYPDFRAMINKLQELAPKITADMITKGTDLEERVYELLKARKPFDARAFVIENGIECPSLLKYLMNKMIGDEDFKCYENWKDKIRIMVRITSDASHKMATEADADIPLFSWMLSFLDTFKVGRIAEGSPEERKLYELKEIKEDLLKNFKKALDNYEARIAPFVQAKNGT